MRVTPWLSICIGFALMTTGTGLVLLLPETLPKELRNTQNAIALGDDENEPGSPAKRAKVLDGVVAHVLRIGRETRALFGVRSLPVVIPSFLFATLGQCSVAFLLQYASDKFDWTFDRVSVSFSSQIPTTRSHASER